MARNIYMSVMRSSQYHRFYENEFPEVGSLVIGKVIRVEAAGLYVELPEYGNLEAILLPNEYSEREFKSIRKLVPVGDQEVFVVIGCDAEKGFVDLSKKRVSLEDCDEALLRYSNSKAAFLALLHTASQTGTPLDDLYRTIAWPLNKRFPSYYDAFRQSIEDPDVWKDITFPNESVATELKLAIKERFRSGGEIDTDEQMSGEDDVEDIDDDAQTKDE